ncbi:MAG: pentapeptide repeat-containing protein [Gammaproteobacteria bacterium]|nr:pentapeptide repeat-containing protein [Gammaproteobacteria bacterium]
MFDLFAKLLAVPWIVLVVWSICALAMQMLEPIPGTEQAESRRAYFYAIGLTFTGLGALIAAPLVLVRTFLSDRQAQAAEEHRQIQQEEREIAEQTHFTTLYSKAVQQLGANTTALMDGREKMVPSVEIRLGAIYALERIAKQSDADYVPIMETLCAYVRQNSGPAIEIDRPNVPDPVLPSSEDTQAHQARLDAIVRRASPLLLDGREIRKEVSAKRAWMYADRPDVRAALDVVMRRPGQRRKIENYSLDQPPDLEDVGESEHRATRDSAGEPLSRTQTNEKLKRQVIQQRLQRMEKRYENITEFKEQLDAWKAPRGDDAWTPDLDGAVLQGVERQRVDFRRVSLRGARLEGVWLFAALMQGADLERARLEGSYLPGADMRGANLSWARLDGAHFMEAAMDGADLGAARMQGADLSDARLGGAEFDGARAEGAKFRGAHMEGAYFGGARLERADFQGADLEGAVMGMTAEQSWLMQTAFFREAPVTPPEWTMEARLPRAMGMQAMGAANLTEAKLEAADLRSVRMDEATLCDTDMTCASLKDADLSKSQCLTQEQVDAAFGDGSVSLPEGIRRPEHWRSEDLTDAAYYGRFRSWIKSLPLRSWPHASVFSAWENVEQIPFDSPAEPSEIRELTD